MNIEALIERMDALEKRIAKLESQQNPLSDEDAGLQEGSITETLPEAGKPPSPTILLVDDEPMIIDIAKQMLEVQGYQVIVATNGHECLEKYQTYRDRINLVLLDLIMPDMGGGETFEKLQEIDPQVRVILSSGFGNCDDTEALLAQGCLGFIQKPFTLQVLTDKLKSVFTSH